MAAYELMTIDDVMAELGLTRRQVRPLFDDRGGSLKRLAGTGCHVKTTRAFFEDWYGLRADAQSDPKGGGVSAVSSPVTIEMAVFS